MPTHFQVFMPHGIQFLVRMYDTVDELDKFIYLQISLAVAPQIRRQIFNICHT